MKNILLTILYISIFLTYSQSFAKNYYVDNELGNNSNSGLIGFPWENTRKVNNFNFEPGDTIHFRRGRIWQGENINITESGTEALPITITHYGEETSPKPILSGAAPLDKEFTGTWDFDIYTENPSSSTDDFSGWAESAISPNLIKADSGYLNKGVSAKLQDNGSGSPRIWRNTSMALAADIPMILNLRFKVESGNLFFLIKNLNTGNYYNQSGTWGSRAAAAIYSSTQYGDWSEISLEISNDISLGQISVELLADGTAFIDEVSLALSWTEHSPGIYKRAILSGIVNGVYDIYVNGTQSQREIDAVSLTENFDWIVNTQERVLYMYYSGSLTELNNEPLLVDRGSYYPVYLEGNYLTVDGLHIEKSITGIRVANDNVTIKNNLIQYIGGECGILAVKISGGDAVHINNIYSIKNEILDSGCGIYYRRVDNSLISGNLIRNIRDRGYGGDVEIMGLESMTNSIIEHNEGSDGIIGIDLWAGPGHPSFGNVFRYNIIHNVDSYGIFMGGAQDDHGIPGGVIRGYNYNNLIHNNIVYNNGFGSGYETRGSGLRQNNTPREEDGPNYWYNNTMYANKFNFSGSTSFAGRFVFINNLSLDPVEKHLELDGTNAIYNDLDSAILSHNSYYPDGGTGTPLFNWHGDYETFSDYQLASGKDLDGSFVADPMLTNPSIDPQVSDFSLTANSPSINSGVDVGLLQDFDGNPIDGAPDIGSYEHPDADNDGVFTTGEITLGTDPLHPDTDWDGINDGNDIDPIDILHPNSEGWNLSITNNYSDPDVPEGIYPVGITLNILAWTSQLNLNNIHKTEYLLKKNTSNLVVAEVNQAICIQETYTCNTSMDLSSIPTDNYILDIRIQDNRGNKISAEIPVIIQ